MATAAQIEANRRNAQKSTGPRTEEGKNRSKFNALGHGCRARVLVLPDEDRGDYEKKRESWVDSVRPRNPSEEFLADRLAGLSWQAKRVERAQSARLAARVHRGEVDAADRDQTEVIELGQRLFAQPDGTQAPGPRQAPEKSVSAGRGRNGASNGIDGDHPMSLVHRLRSTSAGCRWLLEQWYELRAILERGTPWLAPDQFRAVRLLGRRPTDALYSEEIALVYLASHRLLDQGDQPFQGLLSELAPHEVPIYANYFQLRHYDNLVPEDTDAARRVLLEIADRAIAGLLDQAEVLRQLDELDAPDMAARLLWDDTAEGERLRRYELSRDRSWLRMFELLMKIRRTGAELDDATFAKIRRSVPTANPGVIARPAPVAATVITPPAQPVREPEPAIEANSEGENAPNEPKFDVQTPRSDQGNSRQPSKSERRRARHRVDRGRTGQASFHQELERQVANRTSPLLNVSAIF